MLKVKKQLETKKRNMNKCLKEELFFKGHYHLLVMKLVYKKLYKNLDKIQKNKYLKLKIANLDKICYFKNQNEICI